MGIVECRGIRLLDTLVSFLQREGVFYIFIEHMLTSPLRRLQPIILSSIGEGFSWSKVAEEGCIVPWGELSLKYLREQFTGETPSPTKLPNKRVL